MSKSWPSMMNISFNMMSSCLAAASILIASKRLEMSGAVGNPAAEQIFQQFACWRKKTTTRPAAWERERKVEKLKMLNLSHDITSFFNKTNESCGKLNARRTQNPYYQHSRKIKAMKERLGKPNHVLNKNDAFDIIRKVHTRPASHPMEDLDVNLTIWENFMNATLLEQLFILEMTMTWIWETTIQLLKNAERLISCQTKTTRILQIDSKDPKFTSTNLLHSRAYECANVKVHVFSDSVLCLGRMVNHNEFSKKKKRFSCVKINWVFQPCKSRQFTSQFGVIYLRRTMSTQHRSSLVMWQVNTSSEQSV